MPKHDPNWNPIGPAIAEARELYQRFDHGNVYEPPKPTKAKPEIPGQLSLVDEDET